MTLRRIGYLLLRVATGIASLMVSLYSLYAYSGSHLTLHAPLTALYCLLPLLFFPVFILSIWLHRAAVIAHWAMAAAYLTVFCMLNWRTCSEMGFCTGVAATISQTLSTFPVEITFAVAVLNLTTLLLRSARRPSA
jgi:hypothetical protein